MNQITIAELEQWIKDTDCTLDHIESCKNIDIDRIKRVAGLRTVMLKHKKIIIERELFAKKIVQLCLTGR